MCIRDRVNSFDSTTMSAFTVGNRMEAYALVPIFGFIQRLVNSFDSTTMSALSLIHILFIMSSIPPYDHRGGAAYPGGLVPLGFYILCMALKMSSR